MLVQSGITWADLLEEIVKGDYGLVSNRQVVLILRKALKLKANVEGVIKKGIRETLLIFSR